MKPTQSQYDELAKVFQIGTSGIADGWEELAIDPDYMAGESLPVATRDTLEDFRQAAKTDWIESSACQEINSGLYWEHVQVARGQRRVSLAVLDCGDFRLAYQQ